MSPRLINFQLKPQKCHAYATPSSHIHIFDIMLSVYAENTFIFHLNE